MAPAMHCPGCSRAPFQTVTPAMSTAALANIQIITWRARRRPGPSYQYNYNTIHQPRPQAHIQTQRPNPNPPSTTMPNVNHHLRAYIRPRSNPTHLIQYMHVKHRPGYAQTRAWPPNVFLVPQCQPSSQACGAGSTPAQAVSTTTQLSAELRLTFRPRPTPTLVYHFFTQCQPSPRAPWSQVQPHK